MSELDKWAGVQPSIGVIRDFLDWCSQQKMELATWLPQGTRMMPIGEAYEALLARYFEINTAKLEKERSALLEKCRRAEQGAKRG